MKDLIIGVLKMFHSVEQTWVLLLGQQNLCIFCFRQNHTKNICSICLPQLVNFSEITACSLDEIPTVTNVLPQAEDGIRFWDWVKVSVKIPPPQFCKQSIVEIPHPPQSQQTTFTSWFAFACPLFHWNFGPFDPSPNKKNFLRKS